MRILVWLARAFVFFTLFAFALNNQQPVTVHWFFGVDWSAPTVIVVLTAFALGSVVGVLAMLPSWWRHRRDASRRTAQPATLEAGGPAAAPAVPEQLRRDGL